MPLIPSQQPPYYTTDGTYPTTTLTLTNAQILTLPTTYHQLLPAPGTDKMYLLKYAIMDFNLTAGALTNLSANGHSIQIVLGEWVAELSNYITIPAGATRNIGITSTYAKVNDIPTLQNYNSGVQVQSTDILNLPMKLVAYNDVAGNFTGGNAANTLTITLSYDIITL